MQYYYIFLAVCNIMQIITYNRNMVYSFKSNYPLFALP